MFVGKLWNFWVDFWMVFWLSEVARSSAYVFLVVSKVFGCFLRCFSVF